MFYHGKSSKNQFSKELNNEARIYIKLRNKKQSNYESFCFNIKYSMEIVSYNIRNIRKLTFKYMYNITLNQVFELDFKSI